MAIKSNPKYTAGARVIVIWPTDDSGYNLLQKHNVVKPNILVFVPYPVFVFFIVCVCLCVGL